MVNNCNKSNRACNAVLHLLIYSYWLELIWTGHGTARMAQLCMAWHSMARHGSASALGFRLSSALGTQLSARLGLGLCSRLGSALGTQLGSALTSARLSALGSRLSTALLGLAQHGTARHCMARHGTAWHGLTWPVDAVDDVTFSVHIDSVCLFIYTIYQGLEPWFKGVFRV